MTDDGVRRISDRVRSVVEPSPLTVDAAAKALVARGRPVIALGAGELEFPLLPVVSGAAQRACTGPDARGFAPTAGLSELRSAVVAKTLRDSGLVVAPEQVLITNGAKQALHLACTVLLEPADEVVLIAPFWSTHPRSIALGGGVPVVVPTGPESGYLPTVDQLEAVRTDRTRLLLWCSPANPTGSVAPPALCEAVGWWAVEHGIWVVTDETYEHFVYDGSTAVSLPVAVPELADTCVVVNTVAKTYSMIGWSVGWMVGPADVITAAAGLQSEISSNVATVSQHAALAALRSPLDPVHAMRNVLDRRRRILVAMLNDIPGITCPVPMGAMYAFPDVSALLGRTVRGTPVRSSFDLASVILQHAGVAVVPGEAFGAPGHLRLAYTVEDEQVRIALGRIAALVGEPD